MAKPKAQIVPITGEITLAEGHFALPVATLLALPAEAGPRGMIAVSERAEFLTLDTNGATIPIVASVYVQRGPLNEIEARAVDAAEKDRTAKQSTRKAQQEEQAIREKRAFAALAVDLMKDVVRR